MAPSTSSNSSTNAESSTMTPSTNSNSSTIAESAANTESAINADSSTDIIPFTITEATIDTESTINTDSPPNITELEESELRLHHVLSVLPGDLRTHPPTTQNALITSIKHLVEAMTQYNLPNDAVNLVVDYLFINFHCVQIRPARLAHVATDDDTCPMRTGWSTPMPDDYHWGWNVTNVFMRR